MILLNPAMKKNAFLCFFCAGYTILRRWYNFLSFFVRYFQNSDNFSRHRISVGSDALFDENKFFLKIRPSFLRSKFEFFEVKIHLMRLNNFYLLYMHIGRHKYARLRTIFDFITELKFQKNIKFNF